LAVNLLIQGQGGFLLSLHTISAIPLAQALQSQPEITASITQPGNRLELKQIRRRAVYSLPANWQFLGIFCRQVHDYANPLKHV